MIDLSIIIPHYNSVQQLKKLLLSIPKKKNIQIIVIDDKSDDQLIAFNDIKKNREFDHVLFLNNNTNKKGAGVCRNIGLDYVEGKWVLFADADDYFITGFYEIICEYFNCDYDVIFFKPTSIGVDTGNKSDRHVRYAKLIDDYLDTGSHKSELQLRYRFFVPWSKLINYNFIKINNILFDETIASNDVMFSSKLGYHMKKFKVTSEIIYCVTKGFGTLTTKLDSIIYESRLKVFISYYKFLKENLNKEEFKALNLHGLGALFDVYRNKLGFKKFISVYFELKRNGIKLFDKRLLNPVFTFKTYKQYQKDRKYLLRDSA